MYIYIYIYIYVYIYILQLLHTSHGLLMLSGALAVDTSAKNVVPSGGPRGKTDGELRLLKL